MRWSSSWRYVRPYAGRLASGFVWILGAVGIAIAIPYYVGRAVTALLGDSASTEVPRLAALILALATVQAIARVVGTFRISSVARYAELDLRRELFAHLLALDAGFYRKHRTGDLVARLTNDMGVVVDTWSMGVIWALGATAVIVAAVVVMLTIHATLTLAALAALPFTMLAGQRIGARVQAQATRLQEQKGQLTASVQEDLTGIGVVRAYHLEQQRVGQFRERSGQLIRKQMRLEVLGGLFGPLLAAFSAVSMLTVLCIGGRAVIDGSLHLGALVQFNAYLGMLTTRVVGLGGMISMFQRGRASWKRLDELLVERPAITDGPGPALDPATVRGEIEIRNLSLVADNRRILDGVSVHIPAGTVTAIVGRVGSGKSTLAELIPRLVDVPAGTVFVDGRDITDLPISSLRGAVAYASQSTFLFSASVADNIAFGIDERAADARSARVDAAARAAGLGPDLAILPAGLETQVGERGITLSGGQRQRVALARALASDRRIVILDDSLSSVDAETERTVLGHLDEMLRGRTAIVISHRVAAVRRAAQIVVLDAGRVIEVGSHAALIEKGGVYAELYRAQLDEEPS